MKLCTVEHLTFTR